MAEKVLHKYQTQLGEVVLVPSSGGAFEIKIDQEKIYSKLETGRFPDERVLVQEMAAKI